MELTKVQRNAIFAALIEGGLKPADCEITRGSAQESISSADSVKIIHLPSDSYVVYWAGRGGKFHAECHVGDEPVYSYSSDSPTEPAGVISDWTKEIRAWTATPDLWDDLGRAGEAVKAAERADSSNEPFTPDERDQISAQIQDVKRYIRTTYALTGEKLSLMEARLDELAEDSCRFGRKDWMNSALGAVFGLVLQDVVTLPAATHIVVMVVTGLGHLFGIGHLPPGLPPG